MGTTYKLTGGDKLQKALELIAAKAKNSAVLNVGFPRGATEPDGQPTALVAFLNEFGKIVRSKDGDYYQLPRPYFRNMIAKYSPHWGDDLAKLLKAEDYDAVKALDLLGEDIEGALKKSIQELQTPPLAPSTIKKKHGATKPLIDSGKMFQSTKHWVAENEGEEE